jgi:class 3 adenylate cyclase/pimeloyl-ACP methyl ester carboxylesterase
MSVRLGVPGAPGKQRPVQLDRDRAVLWKERRGPQEHRSLRIGQPAALAVACGRAMSALNEPESEAIRYAKSGGVNIAYQVSGTAPVDLVFLGGWITHLEAAREDPGMARFQDGLRRFARVVDFDKRGTGLSDRVPDSELPTMEQRMDDIRAVMDAAGLERASLLGFSEGGSLAMLFAATYPHRTARLLLWGSHASMVQRPGYPWGMTSAEIEEAATAYSERWGTGAGLRTFVPSRHDDPALRRWWGHFQRMAASPGAAVALLRMNAQVDVRGVLSSVSAPTLILHRRDDAVSTIEHGRYLAEHIAGARLVEIDGADHWPWVGDLAPVMEEIEEFLTGARSVAEPERALATVLFTDIVDSTARAAERGDGAWRDLLERHCTSVRRALDRYRGREVKTIGDGFLATFDGPARAIHCACRIRDDARELGLALRAGLHTGECELMGEDIGGLGVHIGARVAALAQPSEVLVSRTVTDLVAGADIRFEPRGTHELKGVPGAWELFAVAG